MSLSFKLTEIYFVIDMSNKIEPHNSSSTTIQKLPGGKIMQDYLDSYNEVEAREWDIVGSKFEFVLNDLPEKENSRGNGPYSLDGYSSNFIVDLNCTTFICFS